MKEKIYIIADLTTKKFFFNTPQCYYAYITNMSRAINFHMLYFVKRSQSDFTTKHYSTKQNKLAALSQKSTSSDSDTQKEMIQREK